MIKNIYQRTQNIDIFKFNKPQFYVNIGYLTILKGHSLAKPIMVSANGIVEDADGKKIVKSESILSDADAIVNDATAEGVLLCDVDVTYGNAPGSLVMFGFI